jgi:hypothetical protein
MPDYGAFRATEVTAAPAAYLVPPEYTAVIERLEAHGVQIARLDAAAEIEVSEFHIDSTRASEREYQGHRPRQAWGVWQEVVRTFGEGAAVVPVRQPLGRLIVVLLEPRSDDGFLTWNLFDPAIEESEIYPVTRLLELPTESCEECVRFR